MRFSLFFLFLASINSTALHSMRFPETDAQSSEAVALKNISLLNAQLLRAADTGNFAQVLDALNKGANIEARHYSNKTALILAAKRGYDDIVKLLLDRGADVNAAYDDGFTAFDAAAGKGDKEILKLLLDAGANINAASNNGLTALAAAVINSSVTTAKFLLKNKANINAVDELGKTALMYTSTWYNCDEMLNILLEKGADIEAVDKKGNTALMLAADLSRVEIVNRLINAGAVIPDAEKCVDFDDDIQEILNAARQAEKDLGPRQGSLTKSASKKYHRVDDADKTISGEDRL